MSLENDEHSSTSPLCIIDLGHTRAARAEGQLAVDIVFDQRHLVAGQQLDQGALVFLGHAAAQRVAEIGDRHHRPDGVIFQGKAERIQAEPVAGMGGDLQHAQALGLQRLQDAKIGRRFDRHQVARAAGGLQRQVDGFGAAAR